MVAKLIASQSFGDVALINDKPRNATIVAMGELSLVSISK